MLRPFCGVACVCTKSALICVDGMYGKLEFQRECLYGWVWCMHACAHATANLRTNACQHTHTHTLLGTLCQVKSDGDAVVARTLLANQVLMAFNWNDIFIVTHNFAVRPNRKKPPTTTTTSTKDERNMNCIYLTFYENARACNLCEIVFWALRIEPAQSHTDNI